MAISHSNEMFLQNRHMMLLRPIIVITVYSMIFIDYSVVVAYYLYHIKIGIFFSDIFSVNIAHISVK